MKIVAILPSRQSFQSAGVRIRYERLIPAIEEQGSTFELADVGSVDPRSSRCDVLLVSKCYDARALIAAEVARRRGALVGVDLFDDYFSQVDDSRLSRFRSWLSQMLALADFAICSTPRMAAVVAQIAPNLPVRVIRDPAPPVDADRLQSALIRKLASATAERRLRFSWFGMGDNPQFKVGLSDVSAFSDRLGRMATHGIPVDLSILTNVRSLEPAALAAIAAVPFPVSIEEWSAAREATLLGESFACFLPVNAQRFSIAKSTNRAISALCAGCQVLCGGYPLYDDLAEFIYSEEAEFLDDFARGRMRFGVSSVRPFLDRIGALASASAESASLLGFLNDIASADRPGRGNPMPVFVVHGISSPAAVRDATRAAGGLSIAGPLATLPLEFDAAFIARGGSDPVFLVSRRALSRLTPQVRRTASVFGRIGKQKFWKVKSEANAEGEGFDWADPSVPLQLALYGGSMRSAMDQLRANFGTARIIVSETSALPVRVLD